MFGLWTTTGRDEARAVELARDETLRFPNLRGGALVRVERGVVLVTSEGDGQDHVLEAGMELRLPGHGRSVGWALADSRVRVLASGPAAGARPTSHPAGAVVEV